MSADKVVALPGSKVPSAKPNEAVVDLMRKMLEMAESGQLQSFIGTGFTSDGPRLALWADDHVNVYEMLGALTWLQAEYIHKHTEPRK